MKRGLVVTMFVAALAGSLATTAAAQPATVTIDSSEAELSARAEGGWTARVGATNVTDGPVTLSARAAGATDPGCTPSVENATLPGAQHGTLTVVVPAGCKVEDDGFTFELAVEGASAAATAFTVTAKKAEEPARPAWEQLHVFWIVLVFLLVLAALLGKAWALSDEKRSLSLPLEHLDRSWSFGESWATNVTAVGGLLAAFFTASGVMRAILGSDADSALGLLTVGSAIAVGLAAAGPVVVLATKTRREDALTPYGLLIGAAVTLTAAIGQLWIAFQTGRKLDLGGVDTALTVLLVAAGALLAVYAVRTLRQTLDAGVTPPKAKRRAAVRKAKARLVAAQAAPEGHAELQLEALQAVEELEQLYEDDEGPGVRRTAGVI